MCFEGVAQAWPFLTSPCKFPLLAELFLSNRPSFTPLYFVCRSKIKIPECLQVNAPPTPPMPADEPVLHSILEALQGIQETLRSQSVRVCSLNGLQKNKTFRLYFVFDLPRHCKQFQFQFFSSLLPFVLLETLIIIFSFEGHPCTCSHCDARSGMRGR